MPNPPNRPPLWLALLVTSLAGGMGWGIRGQYGHETGAMVPGVLVGLSLVFFFCPRATSLGAARAVALTAIAFSFGGSMTYGQTVGLTHDAPLIGNWEALRWGLTGLFIKGGIWIGFAGAFVGIGLGGVRYRSLEMAVLLFTLLALYFMGVLVLNQPYDPANRELPAIYFSDHWRWEAGDLKPRREIWGGLLFALLGLFVYVGGIKRDRLARNMTLFGFIFGGLGFSLGQCVQALHAWNPELYRDGIIGAIDPYMNWWNMMEITFGLVLGFGLALGVWLNRHLIAVDDLHDEIELSPAVEWLLGGIHAVAIAVWSFMSFRLFDAIADRALTMGMVPIIAIVGGRYWPYLLSLPLLALPIAGKTLRQLSYETTLVSPAVGWIFLVVVPLAITLIAALSFVWAGQRRQSGRSFTRRTLLLLTWLYFALNYLFFEWPGPWKDPTNRSPSAVIFLVCALVITVATLMYGARGTENERDHSGR